MYEPNDPSAAALLRWPAQQAARDQLAALGRPRVLLVAHDAEPPPEWDALEDWVREPVGADELDARRATVERRARRRARVPRVDADGLVWSGERWLHLGDAQRAAARALVERFGQVVPTDDLAAAVAAAGASAHPGAMRALTLRLRERFDELDLAVRTIKGRGLMLTFADDPPVAAAAAMASGSTTGGITSSSAARGGDETGA